jgi:hypothetical protein
VRRQPHSLRPIRKAWGARGTLSITGSSESAIVVTLWHIAEALGAKRKAFFEEEKRRRGRGGPQATKGSDPAVFVSGT